jgi:hypothetical protein
VTVGELAQELPKVAGAYTPPNSSGMPPERITSRSSMLSAFAAIPAMIEVSFPAGFTPADATRLDSSLTRSAISSDSPACSANAITGTSPMHDTKCSSSNSGVALDHPSGSFTSSAFSARLDQDLSTPDPPCPEGTSTPGPTKPAADQLPTQELADRGLTR